MNRRTHDRGIGMTCKDGSFIFHTEDADGNEVPVWEWEHYYDVNVDEHLFERYRTFSKLKHKNLAPYGEYVKAYGLRWPVVQQADGSWRETKRRFSEGGDPYVTPGSGTEYYHSTSGDGKAQVWLRPHATPPEVPDAEYPLWLVTGRVLEHWHSGSMTMRMRPNRQAMPNAYVEVHPEDAIEMGVQNGETVVVESRRGTIELPVWVNGRGNPNRGRVFVPFFDETKLINNLTHDAVDPYSKQPGAYKRCAVRIRKR